MKANEALEKIYLQPSEIKRLPYQNIFCVRPLADNSIEYIRTDAFIKKACEWLKERATITYMNGERHIDKERYKATVEDFKKYMKGE
jgi:hypothetical protein